MSFCSSSWPCSNQCKNCTAEALKGALHGKLLKTYRNVFSTVICAEASCKKHWVELKARQSLPSRCGWEIQLNCSSPCSGQAPFSCLGTAGGPTQSKPAHPGRGKQATSLELQCLLQRQISLQNYFVAQVGFSLDPCTFCNCGSEVQWRYFWIVAPWRKSAAASDVGELKCSITLHIFIKQWVERQHDWEALSYLW